MKLPASLRLILVPIGVLIASKGLQYLTDEHERLSAAIDARRAELADADPPDDDTSSWDQPAQEDFSSPPASSSTPAGKSPVRPRLRSFILGSAAAALGFYAATRLEARAADRRNEAAAHARIAAAHARVAARAAGEVDPEFAAHVALVRQAAPCGTCGEPLPILQGFPGHICGPCWNASDPAGPDPERHAAYLDRTAEYRGTAPDVTYTPHAHTYGPGTCPVCGADGVSHAEIALPRKE